MKDRSIFSHLAILAGILLFVTLIYSRIPGAYYCGFDDFMEQRRLRDALSKPLATDFTAQYYVGYKYRPLTWVMNRLTAQWGSGSAMAFRTRNLAFHFANIALLYGIAMILFRSRMVAATAALLFGVHPLANQGVVGAMWTVAPNAFLLLCSLWLFLLSVHREKRRYLFLALSVFVGWLGLLSYEACLPVFGMMYGYLGVRYLLARKRVERRFVVVLTTLTLFAAGSYFGLRARYLQPGRPHPFGVAVIARNLALYAASPLFLVDPVLAHDWLDTPLPSEVVRGHVTAVWIAVTVLPVLLLAAALAIFRKRIASVLRRLEWPELTFLILAFPMALSPFLFFNSHASETYIYVPVALFVLIVSRILHALLVEGGAPNWKFNYAVAIGTLLAFYCAATWVRNGRVAECGNTARQLLSSLPPEVQRGVWRIKLAAAPGDPQSRTYGMYGYRGVDTLGIGEYGAGAVQMAIRHASHNEELAVEVLTPAELMASCKSAGDRDRCYWVRWDGRLSRFGDSLGLY